MKEWSYLPNAHHIDWVLASLKENTKLWHAALDASWNAAKAAANAAAWNKNRQVSLNEMLNESRLISNSARYAAIHVMVVARYAARHVMAVLIAYDDCDKFLSMSHERLKVWAVLSEDPRAVLLLPMIYVKERLALLATV